MHICVNKLVSVFTLYSNTTQTVRATERRKGVAHYSVSNTMANFAYFCPNIVKPIPVPSVLAKLSNVFFFETVSFIIQALMFCKFAQLSFTMPININSAVFLFHTIFGKKISQILPLWQSGAARRYSTVVEVISLCFSEYTWYRPKMGFLQNCNLQNTTNAADLFFAKEKLHRLQ